MANAKARCVGCKQYRVRSELTKVGLSNVCSDSDECRRIVLDKHRATVRRQVANREKKNHKPRLSQRLRRQIRARDETCRYCGADGYRLEIHHIAYRSQGGPDTYWNLILLCDDHHRLVHSRKKYWQPILRAYIWLYYVENYKGANIARVELELKRRGLLPELVDDPDDGQMID